MAPDTSSIEPIFVSVKTAAGLLGISPWSVYQLLDGNAIKSQYHGRRRLVVLESLREYAQTLPTVAPPSQKTSA